MHAFPFLTAALLLDFDERLYLMKVAIRGEAGRGSRSDRRQQLRFVRRAVGCVLQLVDALQLFSDDGPGCLNLLVA